MRFVNIIVPNFPIHYPITDLSSVSKKVNMLLLIFLQTCALGKCTGISIIDSTPLRSCHIKRMYKHKTMKGWAAKESVLWGGSMDSSYILSSMTKEILYSGCSHLATLMTKCVKQEIIVLIEKEIKRIKEDPSLCHLIKE